MAWIGRFEEIAYEDMDPAQQAVWRGLIEGPRGTAPTPYRLLIASPAAAAALDRLGNAVLRESSLTRRECEIVILVAAKAKNGAFELASHRAIALREGLEGDFVAALCEGARPDCAGRDAVVYDLSCTLVAHTPVDDALFARARETLGGCGLADVSALLGYYEAMGAILSIYAVPPSASRAG